MRNERKNEKTIIALAYLYRYGSLGYIAISLLFVEYFLLLFAVHFFVLSLWTFAGYLRKWKHIYCAYQNSHRKEMTPYKINWNDVKKSDIYLIFVIEFICGVMMLFVWIVY